VLPETRVGGTRFHEDEYLAITADQVHPQRSHPRMELSKKVKIALDETRILILGVQILLGFQLRGVFSDGYEQLPTYVRYLDGLALGLMVCVVGLLITPGPYHRIVESGEDSAHILRLVTVIANLSLFPLRWRSDLMSSSRPGAFSGRLRLVWRVLRHWTEIADGGRPR
jgi:hypothetical protein